MNHLRLTLAGVAFIAGSVLASSAAANSCPSFLDHEQRRLHSDETINLCDIAAGKPLMVVNTASHCGYTGQFKGLETLHQRYQDEGLVVVGFASDDFRQEADSEEEAADICYRNFGVTFTMIAPGAVTGADANPVFREINQQSAPPRWNFTKYLVDAEGNVVRSFPSKVSPDNPELVKAVESVL